MVNVIIFRVRHMTKKKAKEFNILPYPNMMRWVTET